MIIKMIITVMMRMCVCLIDMKMTLLVNRGGHAVVFHVRMRILYIYCNNHIKIHLGWVSGLTPHFENVICTNCDQL